VSALWVQCAQTVDLTGFSQAYLTEMQIATAVNGDKYKNVAYVFSYYICSQHTHAEIQIRTLTNAEHWQTTIKQSTSNRTYIDWPT